MAADNTTETCPHCGTDTADPSFDCPRVESDDIELAYDAAFGYIINSMLSIRRFSGTEAIESLKSAIRAIERGQRTSAEKQRRKERIPRAYIEPPPSPDDTPF